MRGPRPDPCHRPGRPWRARRHAWSMRSPSPAGFPLCSNSGRRSVSVVLAPVNGEVMTQVDRSVTFDDHRGVTADRAEPATQLLRIVDRRGQAHETHLGRAQDEHLLPDTAAVGILDEVDLVEDDRVKALEEIRAGQQHVTEHLGRHDHHGRPRSQRGVSGEQADVIVAVRRGQFRVLLVRERLERCRVEGLAAGAERPDGRRMRRRASCRIRWAPRPARSGRPRVLRKASSWNSSRVNGRSASNSAAPPASGTGHGDVVNARAASRCRWRRNRTP